MRRATSLLLTYGALVVPAVFVSAGLTDAAPRPAGTTLELQVTGQAGVPADASAVVLNITSAGARGTGYITAWPCGATRPNASNLNYGVGRADRQQRHRQDRNRAARYACSRPIATPN